MRNFTTAAFAALIGLFLLGINIADAGQSCRKGFRFDSLRHECVKIIKKKIGAQDQAASSGPQWGPVSAAACARASREQEGNASRCRAYDYRKGGKVLEECAKCCRQLREDIARWRLCHKAGFAPRPPAPMDVAWWSINLDCGRVY